MTCVLAIDIGGTKLAAALVDEEGSVLRSATRPTPRTDVMSALAALITEVTEGGPPPVAAGIGCAGPLDLATGTVSPVNMPSWRGFPLRDEVRRLTGLPTMLAGDAQCFALGEHWLGAGRGYSSLLGIVVSTGIGGGLVIDGAPLLGPTGNAGHVGHMSIDPYGERCECGGRGCVERYSSGPNMARWALENGWTPTSPDERPPLEADGRAADTWTGEAATAHSAGQHSAVDSDSPALDVDQGEQVGTMTGTREKADARALARDAAAGHPVAVAAFERGTRALAAMIASTAAAAEVTTVVIGGGVSGAGRVLFDPLERALDDVAGLAFVRAVQVKQSTLGVRAALAGAADLAWQAVRSGG
ncbi:ROK family protein [Nonomuraea sp. SYSU D8015]|uniref:ROK family protein n=1 Tax=Nonomuraea sp. SYSU D8015 TaxID=2593644 RepID=UPI0016610113|nr:ROK family protein [Nonomuraea sp. SYSU D8015]